MWWSSSFFCAASKVQKTSVHLCPCCFWDRASHHFSGNRVPRCLVRELVFVCLENSFPSASYTSMDHPVIIFLPGYVSSCTFIFLNLSSEINSVSPLIIFIDLAWIFSRMMAPVCSWSTGAVRLTYCHRLHRGSTGLHKYSAQSMPADICLKTKQNNSSPQFVRPYPTAYALTIWASCADSVSDPIIDKTSTLLSEEVHFPAMSINFQSCISTFHQASCFSAPHWACCMPDEHHKSVSREK